MFVGKLLDCFTNTFLADDCWASMDRDPTTNRLVADPKRFPSGMAALADYAHKRKVQLGGYSDIGNATCQNYPATRSFNRTVDYTEVDANTFSEWGIDSLKMDGCNPINNTTEYWKTYPEFSDALNKQSELWIFDFEYLTNVLINRT